LSAAGIPVSIDGARTVLTDSSGRFQFSAVPEGPHHVMLWRRELPAEYDAGDAADAMVTIEPRHTAKVELDVFPLAELHGMIRAPQGVSTEALIVRLLPGERYTTPDADGNFAFFNVREGDYEVVLDSGSLPQYSEMKTPARKPAAVRIGAETPPLEFGFEVRPPERPVRRIDLTARRP